MNSKTLLVVEDEPNLLFDISEILELEGYNVIQACNGNDALEKLVDRGENPPDLIISDIMMPFMNGTDFLKEVRKHKHFRTIPFIFLTAKNSKDDVNYGKILGAEDYITKPFDTDDLLVSVKAKLDRQIQLLEVYQDKVSRIKNELLSLLSHEFRTPLTSIIGYSDILREYDSVAEIPVEELTLFLGEVHKGADRLHHLIENFITLIEIYSGNLSLNHQMSHISLDDWAEIIDNAIEHVSSLNRISASFTTNIPSQIFPIKGNPRLITKMIIEYLHNAAKFSSPNAIVELTLESANHFVRINVIDTGRGIPEQEHEKIWDLMYQIDRRHYEDQGAGCGLTIVKELADLHGASVGVESVTGEGSHFWIIFPTG